MQIVIGSDHAGFFLKNQLISFIEQLGHSVLDVGTDSTDPVDYPDYAQKVGHMLLEQGYTRGILICGSGVGASIAVNKIPGIRAGICHDTYSAHQGVEHDDVNVLVVGSRVIGIELAREIVKTYLSATFSGEERHVRRLGKLKAMEARYINKST
jgi:RpiB/LacA/LacB family sugar-phosphate isomerase